MKKKILTVVLTAVLFALFAVTAFAYSTGDVNNSGDITAADARLTLRYSASLESFNEEQVAAADVDKSGEVTASDARTILRISAGLDSFEAAEELNAMLIEPGVLNVAVCADNYPFCYTSGGEYKGIDIDVAKKLASAFNLELKFHNMTADKLAESVKNNQCDIALATKSDINSSSQDLYSATYNNNTQYIYHSNSSSINSSAQLKSKNIGVMKGSVADLMLTSAVKNGELGDAKIFKYSRYADAVDALNNKEIFAFVGDDQFGFCDVSRYSGYYVKEDYCIVSSAEKSELVKKFEGRIHTAAVKPIVEKHCPPVIPDSAITCESSSITLAPGGTAVLEVKPDSFYGYNDLGITANDLNMDAKLTEYNDKFYLTIIAPYYETSGKIELFLTLEANITCTIDVKVSKSGGTKYNFGTESYCPDLGAYSGVAPYEVMVDVENQAIGYIYNAEDLYNAGMKDTPDYEKYLELLEKQGFVADSYMTDDYSYYSLYFVNESLEQVVAYTEYYYYDGTYLYLTAVSVTVSHQF
ncbi:MAG: transporter substrate-binding domain-containing protein [Clostridia bacterium]|nr:transporter substrate-binding domain-containing protein [Clostridia bacterium]